jgi:CubicO group peptidase (beta-lactamase class C family)
MRNPERAPIERPGVALAVTTLLVVSSMGIVLAACGETGSEATDSNHGPTVSESVTDQERARPTEVDCSAIAGSGSDFYQENVVYQDLGPGPDLSMSSPRAEDMDPRLLDEASAQLSTHPQLVSFLVMRHGAVVVEEYFNGFGPDDAHNVHSVSKSMLSTLIGIAVERGEIEGVDQRLADILPDYFAKVEDRRKLDLTVRHLLTMTGGLDWTEDATEYQVDDQADWVQAILDRPLAARPGRVFRYNTGLTHLGSAVLTEATGMSTCEYAMRWLFDPLGVTVEHWGRDPQGYFTGGFDLYLTARELAAFGQLHLAGGVWDGEELISSGFVSEAAEPHAEDYGYLWWLQEVDGRLVQTAWGYGGQFIYVIEDLDLVVVMTTDTQHIAADFDGLPILADYVIPAAQPSS